MQAIYIYAKRLLTFVMAILLSMLLISCQVPQILTETPEDPPVSITPEASLPISPEIQPPVSPEIPSPEPPSPTVSRPPLIPEEERIYTRSPYLVKLAPYTGVSYTDGYNTYIIESDGTVRINSPNGVDSGNLLTLEARDISKPPVCPKLYYTDEFAAIIKTASEKVSELMGYEYGLYADLLEYRNAIIHKDGDIYYLHVDNTQGGGSGESYYHADGSYFLKISTDGETVDYGKIRAVHIVWHDGYFYYVELAGGLFCTPGIGRVMRMDMDGSNKKTIVSEPVYGPFTITDDRLYYSSLADGKAYSVGLDGKDKTPVGSRFAPDNHRVSLHFYDDIIISDFWYSAGYGFGVFVYPDYEVTGPAIMDKSGDNLLTFPAELCGDSAYEVVNWGDDSDEYSMARNSYLFLKSNYDGSYWVYKKAVGSIYGDDPYFALYEQGRQEWAAKGG